MFDSIVNSILGRADDLRLAPVKELCVFLISDLRLYILSGSIAHPDSFFFGKWCSHLDSIAKRTRPLDLHCQNMNPKANSARKLLLCAVAKIRSFKGLALLTLSDLNCKPDKMLTLEDERIMSINTICTLLG